MASNSERYQLPKVSRRDFLKLGMGYIGYETLLMAGLLKESERVHVHHYLYRDETLPEEWDGTTVVHISDLHIEQRHTGRVDPDTIAALSLQIQEYLHDMHADPTKTFLFDTGDAVSYIAKNGHESVIDDLQESLSFFSAINAHYKYAVAGNHDVAHSHSNEIPGLYRAAGYTYADDGIYSLSSQLYAAPTIPFLVLTAPDFTTRRGNWYKSSEAEQLLDTLETIPSEQLTVLLTHNPSMVDVWQGGRVADILKEKKVIVFSGHTHGGQLNTLSPIQSLGMSVGRQLKDYDSELIKGVYRIGTSMVNVNTGVGFSKGIRTLPPSFDVFEFRR